MNGYYISRALCFHGQPLQKIWEDERGEDDLQKWGVTPQSANYAVFLERQKHFTFQDRAKRLKMHQFFSRKASDLYDKNLKAESTTFGSDYERLSKVEHVRPYVAALPPFEIFVNKNQEKFKRLRCLLEGLNPGDVVYGVVLKTYQLTAVAIQPPLMIKPLCTAEPLVRYLGDVTIKGAVQRQLVIKPEDKRGNPRNFHANDFVCCEVVDVSVDADRLNLSMKSKFSKNKNIKFGLVSAEELPEYYRIANNNALEKYNDCLHKMKEFFNPNYDVLYELLGFDVKETFTLMHKLKHPFPQQEYASELRQAQASRWAFRSVAEGIDHFKLGRHVEAFQCLNKALNIDPRNVEGLVARGALYANKGSFLKAVDDFEKALKLNSFHVNARKYMGETLVALGRSYEEEGRFEEAQKAYKDCLKIVPTHEQARLGLELLQQRPGSQLLDNLLNIPSVSDLNSATKRKKRKHDHSASGSSHSNSSDSESDSDSDSSGKPESRTKKYMSLSPLSKRIAQNRSLLPSARNQYSQPFYLAHQNSTESTSFQHSANDFLLDEDDTESRVQKLLQEASKYKKQKKKSKKKKSKKSKKESRKSKTNFLLENFNKIDFKDAFQSVSGLDMENKLTDNLQLYEQTITKIKKHDEMQEQLSNHSIRDDTPPPKAPSMNLHEEQAPPPPPIINKSLVASAAAPNAIKSVNAKTETAPRFSFTIKRPIKVDKFGLLRIATPKTTTNKSPIQSRYSRSRSRSRSRSTSRRRHSRRSGSRGFPKSRIDGRNYRRRSRTRSRTRSRSLDRSRRARRSLSRPRRSRSRGRINSSRSPLARRRPYGRRRTPSPFVPRGTPPPSRRRSRSRDSVEETKKLNSKPKYGNRIWQRPGYKPPPEAPGNIGRWVHDKFYDEPTASESKKDDGPTIEEIDEIINKAQKERKEEIIKRDKDILKKAV